MSKINSDHLTENEHKHFLGALFYVGSTSQEELDLARAHVGSCRFCQQNLLEAIAILARNGIFTVGQVVDVHQGYISKLFIETNDRMVLARKHVNGCSECQRRLRYGIQLMVEAGILPPDPNQ
jgi:hypothetical protein